MINLFSLNQLSLKTNDKDNAKPYAESLLYAEVQPAFVKIFAKVRLSFVPAFHYCTNRMKSCNKNYFGLNVIPAN